MKPPDDTARPEEEPRDHGWGRPPLSEPLELLWRLRAEDSQISVYLRPERRRVRYHLEYGSVLLPVGDGLDGGTSRGYRVSATSLRRLLRLFDRDVGPIYGVCLNDRPATPWWLFRPCDVSPGGKPALRRLLLERLNLMSKKELAEYRRARSDRWREILRELRPKRERPARDRGPGT